MRRHGVAIATLVAALVASCARGGGSRAGITASATPSAASTSTPLAGVPWLVFASYPGAHEVCWQHVTGDTMHIVWQMYATPDPIDRVRAFYVRVHAPLLAGDALRAGDDVLSFHAKDTPGYPICEGEPAPSDQTVFIVSHAVR